MTVKDKMHALVDILPEGKLQEAERLLLALLADDPLLATLAAALQDEEPETEGERRTVAASWEAFDRGEGIPHEEMRPKIRPQKG